MSWLDWLVAVLGVANIVLIVRRSIWNFPVALVMVSIFGVRLAEERLYSDAGLQVFFFAMNIYGWWAWTRNKGETGALVVERLSNTARWSWVAGTALTTALWGTAMARFTSADFPWWDGAIAMISVAAQILMTRRYLENWHGWILVNILSIPLYVIKGLYPQAGLFMINLVIAIAGLIEWQKVRKAAQS